VAGAVSRGQVEALLDQLGRRRWPWGLGLSLLVDEALLAEESAE
jgi:hypothetical protein